MFCFYCYLCYDEFYLCNPKCLFLKIKKFISEQKLFIKLGVIIWSDTSADFMGKFLDDI